MFLYFLISCYILFNQCIFANNGLYNDNIFGSYVKVIYNLSLKLFTLVIIIIKLKIKS